MGSIVPKSLGENLAKGRPEPEKLPFNELSAKEQYELMKQVWWVKDWNASRPMPTFRPPKAAGKPSYQLERDRNIVT